MDLCVVDVTDLPEDAVRSQVRPSSTAVRNVESPARAVGLAPPRPHLDDASPKAKHPILARRPAANLVLDEAGHHKPGEGQMRPA